MIKNQTPEKLMDVVGLKEGMTIADTGAARGRLSIWFVDSVGEKGKVRDNIFFLTQKINHSPEYSGSRINTDSIC